MHFHAKHFLVTSNTVILVFGVAWLALAPSAIAEESRLMNAALAAPERKPNRLIHEKSPYLLQHAHNPVDWYPWGAEAFAKAKREEKPIFLSGWLLHLLLVP